MEGGGGWEEFMDDKIEGGVKRGQARYKNKEREREGVKMNRWEMDRRLISQCHNNSVSAIGYLLPTVPTLTHTRTQIRGPMQW